MFAAAGHAQENRIDRADLARILTQIGPLIQSADPYWSDGDAAQFAALRAELDAALGRDPSGEVAAEWLSGRLRNAAGVDVGWQAFSP